MSNSFIMTESIVRPAKMPYGRLKDNGFVGIEGEHAARALVVETKDDLSAFASINLIIDDLDCGAMTKTTSGSTTTLSMTLTSSMIGRSGRKICQLIMVNSGNTVVQKSSQFEAYVGRANEIERSVDDGVTIIILSEAVTEMAREAAAAAAEEAAAGIVDECQDIADAASASADAAAQSAQEAEEAAASIVVDATLDPTSTHAIQNKVVASEISSIKADLGDLTELETSEKSDLVSAINEAASSGGGGVSQSAVDLLMSLFREAMYESSNPSAIEAKIVALDAAFSVGRGYSAIVYDLDHVGSSNNASYVQDGASYTTILTATTEYELNEVSVVMDGVDITSSVYSSGTISIDEVSGILVITAKAIQTSANPLLYRFNLKSGLTDDIDGAITAEKSSNISLDNTGATIPNSADEYISFSGIFDYDRSFVLECGTFNRSYANSHSRLLMVATSTRTNATGSGLLYRANTGWTWYARNTWGSIFSDYAGSDASAINAMGNSRLTMYVDVDGYLHFYKDGIKLGQSSLAIDKTSITSANAMIVIGSSDSDHLGGPVTIESLKVYSGDYEGGGSS